MKITAFQIYLVGVADGVRDLAGFLFLVALLASLVSLVALVVSCCRVPYDKDDAETNTTVRRMAGRALCCMVPLVCATALISTLTPSSRTLSAMFVLPPLVNCQLVQEDIPAVIRAKAAEWIGELRVGGQDKLPDGKEAQDGKRQ